MNTCPSCAGRGYTIGPPDARGFPVLARCPEPHAGCLCTGASDAICELPDGRLGDCPVCGPALARMRRATDSLRAAGVPEEFRGILPAQLAGAKRRELALRNVDQAVRDWADPDCPQMRGIAVLGDVGRGKTELICAILNALVIACGVTARFCNLEELYARLRTMMDQRDERGGESEGRIIRPYATARVLVLDDLMISQLSPHEQRITYGIVNRRHANRRKHLTHVTTNRSEPELAKINAGRIWSRVMGMCSIITLTGPDHRATRTRRRTVGADPEPAA